ncbi:hypothetical protein IJ076_02660 [Candidatus Saccharibacteria bacterium]|nr:hypothetical protein [Candidatus Saccharibacteria bacterium]
MENQNTKLFKSAETILKIHAKALEIPSGSANVFISHSIKAAEKSLKKRKIITKSDVTRAVAKELNKYNPDLAYVYENYDKII